MSSKKHTPGPWHTNNGCSRVEANRDSANWRNVIGLIDRSENSIPLAEMEANARLIAAAPDLLDACKAALIELRDTENKIAAIETIKRAIAKAEGTGSC